MQAGFPRFSADGGSLLLPSPLKRVFRVCLECNTSTVYTACCFLTARFIFNTMHKMAALPDRHTFILYVLYEITQSL